MYIKSILKYSCLIKKIYGLKRKKKDLVQLSLLFKLN